MTTNPSKGFGFVPDLDQGLLRVRRYYLAAAGSFNIGIGDLMQANGSGDSVLGYPDCIQGTSADSQKLIGAVVGFRKITDTDYNPYLPSGVAAYVDVADHPDQIFRARVNGTLAVTDCWSVADISLTNVTDTTTGKSGMDISATVSASSSVKQIQILDYLITSEFAVGANCVMKCRINFHALGGVVSGQ